jgi:predicted DsbA family dithiol-disulfide isomerase
MGKAMMALAEMGLPAAAEHIRDVREMAALGVFGVPALMINGEVKAVGSVPTKAMLKEWLTAVESK